MIKNIRNAFDNVKNGLGSTSDKRNDAIVLKIMAKGETIAYLSTEDNGEIFTLTYTDKFPGSGVPPLNMGLSEIPKIGKVYKSNALWPAFASRVPSPKRPDYLPALERAGLTGSEPILEIIGKLSKVSISRSWTLEIKAA